jgi:hypothetical protein
MPDPSPQEIADRAAAIRETWSDAEHLRRCRVDWRPTSVVTRRYRVTGGTAEPVSEVDG